MRLLITGSNGLLGNKLLAALASRSGFEGVATLRAVGEH